MQTILVPNDFVARLNRASAAKRFYPFDDSVIDWSVPLSSEYLYMPEELSFLYGSDVWERLSDEARSFVSRWEITQMFRNAGLGEHILNQGVLSLLWRTSQHDPSWRFMLHEVAEECQHMAMFNQWVVLNGDIRTVGLGEHRLAWLGARFGQRLATLHPELFWVDVLLFEAVGDDVFQRFARNASGRIHPILQQLGRAHVVEEARHIAFATKWLEKSVPTLSVLKRRLLHDGAALALAGLARRPRLFPLFWSRQLAPYMSKAEFRQAIHSPESLAYHRTHVAEVVERLAGVGAVRRSTAAQWGVALARTA